MISDKHLRLIIGEDKKNNASDVFVLPVIEEQEPPEPEPVPIQPTQYSELDRYKAIINQYFD